MTKFALRVSIADLLDVFSIQICG